MPYRAHFGLKDHPFTLTPNVDYYFPTQDNANIIASLDFALRRDSGIIKIVGEVGTGKTLLCRLLINKLVDTDKVAYINAPQADSKTIIRTVCEEFGVETDGDGGPSYAGLNRFLLETHAAGKLAVVVVDEAQHLGRDGLEAVRLISNLETEKNKLLQIVLFGQTELDELLAEPSLRQLAQRIVFSFNTKPLTVPEAKRYVAHRIRVSRREGVEYAIFSDAALTTIAKRSGGTPRVMNILADKSLLVAFSDGSPTVQNKHALEAVKDTPGLTVGASGLAGIARIGGWALAGLATAAVLVAAGLYVWQAIGRGTQSVAAVPTSAAAVPPATAPAAALASTAVQPVPAVAEPAPSEPSAASSIAREIAPTVATPAPVVPATIATAPAPAVAPSKPVALHHKHYVRHVPPAHPAVAVPAGLNDATAPTAGVSTESSLPPGDRSR